VLTVLKAGGLSVDYPIEPYVGVGPIRLGMTIDEVRRAVGGEVHPFRKGRLAKWDTDAFNDKGIHVHYKDPGICDAVEFWGATMPTLDGHPLLKRPLREVYTLLKARDPSLQVHDTGLTSYLLGVGIYVSSMKEEDAWEQATEGVIVFEQGHYG
jgi:hypothetical protein